MTAPPASLAQRTASGAAWGAGGALAIQFVSLFVQAALTYFLTRTEYGTYAKAFALLNVAMLFQQLGFREVLLRRGASFRLWRSDVFWFSTALGAIGTLVLAVAAVFVLTVLGDPRLAQLIGLCAPVPLIRSVSVGPTIDVFDAMRFRLHHGLLVFSGIAASLASLAFAYAGWGERCFALASLIVEPLYALALWRASGFHVRRGPRLSHWIPLAARLRLVFGASAASWARSGSDPLLLGAFAAPAIVAVYFFAQNVMNQVFRLITLNLSSVLLPALNKLGDDPGRQSLAYSRAARVLLLVGAPVCVGLGMLGPVFVSTFLDAGKWHDLPPVIAILAVGAVFRLLDAPTQTLLAAQGRFRLSFVTSVVLAVTYIATCTLFALSGSATVYAIVSSVFATVTAPVVLAIAIRPGGGTLRQAARIYFEPLLIAAATIAPWALLDGLIGGTGRARSALVMALEAGGAAVSYVAVGRLLGPPGWTELIERIAAVLPRPLRPLLGRLCLRGGAADARR